MSLQKDIRIYCCRPQTDILGIFHAQNAARDAARLTKDANARSTVHPREYLGDDWSRATSKETAENVFFREISQCKKFSGMYGIRKRDRYMDAYAIFGLSDSVHGIHLLSDAIAKDFGLIVEHDVKEKGPSLFADVDAKEAFDALVEIVRPVIESSGYKTGQELAIAVLREAGNLEKVFGRYTEKDYTKAARIIRGS